MMLWGVLRLDALLFRMAGRATPAPTAGRLPCAGPTIPDGSGPRSDRSPAGAISNFRDQGREVGHRAVPKGVGTRPADRFGLQRGGSEFVFEPSGADAAEGDHGVLMGRIYDADGEASELVLGDAATMVSVQLPVRVPTDSTEAVSRRRFARGACRQRHAAAPGMNPHRGCSTMLPAAVDFGQRRSTNVDGGEGLQPPHQWTKEV